MALAAYLGGWSEISLHLAFLLPAVAAGLGTYFLARQLSSQPLTAALLCLFTPVFMLSGTTVMCDMMMTAFYVWAVYFWMKGIAENRMRDLGCASLLVAVCCLTKYFGITLIPLLLIYTICSKQGRKQHALLLIVPVIILACYQSWTNALYGRSLLWDAASYATESKGHTPRELLANFMIGLSFLGGCLLPFLLLMPLLWGKRSFSRIMASVPLLAVILSQLPFPEHHDGASWPYFLQFAFFMVVAIQLLAVTVGQVWREKSPEAVLLLLWITGTFGFAAFLNWTVSGRNILPMAPALGILLVRALAVKGHDLDQLLWARSKPIVVCLSCAWLFSMTVTCADYSLAATSRTAASTVAEHKNDNGRQPIVFQGHWGFQYYMEQNGLAAFVEKRCYSRPLTMIVPVNNTNIDTEVVAKGGVAGTLALQPLPCITTMNRFADAGFYSSDGGALPFAFGSVPEERYLIVQFR